MQMLEKRISRILNELKESITSNLFPLERYKFKKTIETGFEGYNFDQLDWPLWENRIWKANHDHYWFVTEFEIPEELDGKCVVYRLETGREGDWDATNPQFEIYVNGKTVQGLDVNHRTVILSHNAKAGEKYRISLRAYDGEQEVYIIFKSCICELNKKIMNLYFDMAVPYEVAMMLDKDEKNYIDIVRCLNETINLLDLRQPFSAEFFDSIDIAQKYLSAEFYGKLCGRSEAEVWCVGHTHIDVAWLWTLAITREKAFRSFSTVLELMKEYPEYIFMSSQPQLYQYVKERSPELYKQIGERIKEGRWEPEGGMWLEADCNLSSGEALVRQILFGKRFFKEEFGADNKILWLPDAFGYSAALPQILQKSGMPYFMTIKLSWNEYNKMPYDTFVWRGIDGTGVLTHFIPSTDYEAASKSFTTTYNSVLNASHVKGAWKRYQQKELNNKVLMSFGFGDGGGGPTVEMLENQRRLARGIPGCPKSVMKTAGEYFRTLEEDVKSNKLLPTWSGELYLEYHRGTYTSMARNKKYNRKSEFLMQNLELLSSINTTLTGAGYSQSKINANWVILLRNQFHDILPGSAIKEVYEDSQKEYETLKADAGKLLDDAAANIISKIDLREDSIIVFNPLSFEYNGIVNLSVPGGYDNPTVYEEIEGQMIRHDCQLINEGNAIFYAGNVPPKGYKSFILKNETSVDYTDLLISESGISNRFFNIKLDEKGHFISIYDKIEQREVLTAGKSANVLTAYEDKPFEYDNWNIDSFYKEKYWEVNDVQAIEIVEKGPVRACLKIKRKLLNSTIAQFIYVYRDIARIDVKNEIDWHETNQLLRVSFPVDVHANEATFEIQYGNVKRPTHFNTSWDTARFEVCAHKWMDLSEDEYGVSILNDCKYGCDVHDGVMSLSLIKSGIYPNREADKEKHEFTYSIYPHKGDWKKAKTVSEAYSLNNPVTAYSAKAHPGVLGDEFSFVKCNAENVIIESVKKAEDSDDYILRLYECYNRRTKTSLEFPFEIENADECDLMENKVAGAEAKAKEIEFEIMPYEIKTFKVCFKH